MTTEIRGGRVLSQRTRPMTRDGRREWESERVGGGTRPPKPKPDFADDHQSRCGDNREGRGLPPLLSILRRRRCLPLLPLWRLTISLLPPSLPLSTPSLPSQPQWRWIWRRRHLRLATLHCIEFGVIKTDGVGHDPEGHRAQELGVQRLTHRWGHGQKQWKCQVSPAASHDAGPEEQGGGG